MQSKISVFFLLITLALFQNACFADKSISQLINDAPKNVLVGTDVQLLNSFTLSGEITSGQYTAEMGGADLTINIVREEKLLKIKRSFQEAGLPKENMTYSLKDIKKQFIDNSEISLVAIKSGLLLQEKNSKSFGIPKDMWILYTKK